MQRTTLITSVTISSLLVAGIAWAGSAALSDDTPAVTVASAAAAPDDSATPDDAPTSDGTPLPGPVTATQQALEAGSVTVTAEGTTVRLVAVDVAEGWREEVEVAEGLEVEVTFRRDGARIDVKAEVDDGELRFRVRDRRTDERTETQVGADGTTSSGDDDADDRSGPDDDDSDDADDDRSGSDDASEDDHDADDDSDDADDDSDDSESDDSDDSDDDDSDDDDSDDGDDSDDDD